MWDAIGRKTNANLSQDQIADRLLQTQLKATQLKAAQEAPSVQNAFQSINIGFKPDPIIKELNFLRGNKANHQTILNKLLSYADGIINKRNSITTVETCEQIIQLCLTFGNYTKDNQLTLYGTNARTDNFIGWLFIAQFFEYIKDNYQTKPVVIIEELRRRKTDYETRKRTINDRENPQPQISDEELQTFSELEKKYPKVLLSDVEFEKNKNDLITLKREYDEISNSIISIRKRAKTTKNYNALEKNKAELLIINRKIQELERIITNGGRDVPTGGYRKRRRTKKTYRTIKKRFHKR